MRIRLGKIIVIITTTIIIMIIINSKGAIGRLIPIDKNWRSAKAILARGGMMRDKASEC